MRFENVAEWAFKAVIGLVVTSGVHTLGEMKDSIATLNERVAVIMEKTSVTDKRLDRVENHGERQDDRIRDLEVKTGLKAR